MKKLTSIFNTLIVLLTISVAGCATPRPVVVFQPRQEKEELSKVAVLPFENVSETLDAGRRITSIFLTKLFNASRVNVIEEGEVERFLRANRIRKTGEIDRQTATKLCESLNIQAIVIGSVGEYTFVNGVNGKVPVVSVSVRIVDKTGDIILAVTHVREGDDSETVFGIGRITSAIKLSDIVIADIVDKIVEFVEFYNASGLPSPGETGEEQEAIEKEEATEPEKEEEGKTEQPPPEKEPVPEEKEPPTPSGELTEADINRLREQAKENALKAWDRIKKKYESEK